MREKLSFDYNWRFHDDNLQVLEPLSLNYTYFKTKAESGRGPADPAFYDLDWEIVNLPHDFVIDEKPDITVPMAQGFFRRKNAWYRRVFQLHEEDRNKRIFLLFDGVSTHCTVWVNGHLLQRNFCGYTSFVVDITEVVNTNGNMNIVSVYVDTGNFEGWWYEGGGIYRHVWMVKTADVSVDQWGTFVKTKLENGKWTVDAETIVRNDSYEKRQVVLVSKIVDSEGCEIGRASQSVLVEPREKCMCKTLIAVENPNLWSIEAPNLYKLQSIIVENGNAIDDYETTFGFRTIRFDADEGFFLNEKPVKIKGVCCHEDYSNLGVAVPDQIHKKRLEALKDIGCNAYRCSHNPPTPEILQYCDELGLLVMDENRWFNSSPEGLGQLKSMIIRDRNHPSIILWSMANEEPLQGCERGKKMMASMQHCTKKLDNTRPVMLAMHNGIFNKAVSSKSDVIGINYNEEMYDEIHKAYPDTPLVISEIGGLVDEMSVMRDGSGYDWSLVDTRPFISGMFKWAGFQYRGETRGWPKLFSRSGICCSTGEYKENSYFYKQMWSEEDFVKIYPFHWNWPELLGDDIEVHTYTTGDEVELVLNGISIGKQSVNPYKRTTFRVKYDFGTLKAIAYRNNEKIAEDAISTTGHPAKICLTSSMTEVTANQYDTFTVTVNAVDKDDKPVLWAGNTVRFRVEGDAEVLAVCSTDVYDSSHPKAMCKKLFDGTCQLIVRAGVTPGDIRITAESDGLEAAALTIPAYAGRRSPHVPAVVNFDSLTYFAKME